MQWKLLNNEAKGGKLMLKVAVYNQEGQKVKDTELNESVFGIEPNNQAIFDMVLLQSCLLYTSPSPRDCS